MEYYWIETPEKLESVPDPQRRGIYLEALSKAVEGPLSPQHIVDDARPDNMQRPRQQSDAEKWRILQACDMILCLGVKDADEPEWLRNAKSEAKKEKDHLESDPGPGWTGLV